MVTWSDLAQLRRDNVPERTIIKVARDHGLQLPHTPAVRYEGDPAPGVQRWALYCQGCELEQGVPLGQCLRGEWTGPAVLLNPGPVQWAVGQVLDALETASG